MRRFEGLGPRVAIALLMASGACEPPPTQPEGGRTPRDDGSSLRLSGAGGLSVEDTTDIYATPAYEVDLQIDGSLRPGEPLSITATATANVPVPNTELRLLLPEVRAAESGAPAEFRVPVKQRIPAYGRVTRSLQAGQAASVSGSVPIPHPGYYRALAVAVDTMVSEGELAAATGGFVQTHVFRRLWLFVSPDGGRVTEVFDTTLIADSLRAQPGPFRPRWSTPVGTRNASAGPSVWFAGNMATTTSNPQPYEYELLYDKDQNGIMEPVPDAKVTVTHYPVVPPFGQDPIVVQKWTDSNGRFTVSCFTTHSHYIVTTSGSNADVEIGGLGNASGQYNDCAQGVNLEQQIIANTEKAQLYVYMNEVIPASRSLLGRSRGKIQIDLDPGASNSFYSPSQDRIVIKSGSGGHIFDEFGLFVAPHEYGHAVHHKALGGLNPDFNDNCANHSPGQLSSMGCALSEGFADYHGVAIGGPGASWYPRSALGTSPR